MFRHKFAEKHKNRKIATMTFLYPWYLICLVLIRLILEKCIFGQECDPFFSDVMARILDIAF